MSDRLPDRLFEQLPWLRSLAHQLTRDPHMAEDLVQDTVVAALSSSGARPTSLRAWLGSIVRHALFQRRRADARRVKREQRVAEGQEGTAPSSLDVVAELSTYRMLLELVDGLQEPYRTAITRRFLRGESPGAIARALGVPRKTIYTRIDRGLMRLRRQLDTNVPGGRRAWRGTFALARMPLTFGSVPLTGITLMKTKLVVAALAVASLLILWSSTWAGEMSTPVPAPSEQLPVVSAQAPETPPVERQVVGRAPATPRSSASDPAVPQVRGLVVDVDGHPVGDLQLVFEVSQGTGFSRDPTVEPIRADAQGTFELPLPGNPGRLRVADVAWATALHPWLEGAVPAEPPIAVVAPLRTYAGLVVDEDDLPVAGARIDLELAEAWAQKLEALGRVVALPETLEYTHSDARGAFRFPSVPFIAGSTVTASRDGYESDSRELPGSDHDNLVLTLASVSGRGLRGIVLDARARPVAGARVSTGMRAVETRADGTFTVDPPRLRTGSILALKEGLGMASLSFAENPRLLEGHDDLVLRLSGEPLAIRGVLVDADGSPVRDATVWTPDTSYFGEVMSLDMGKPVVGMNTIEGLLSGTPTPSLTVMTTTREDGSFELPGLTRRAYALFALREADLAAAGPVYAEPGNDAVRLALSAGTPEPVSGRVVSRSGAPLADVRIMIGRTVPWDRPARAVDPWAASPVRPPAATRSVMDPVAVTDRDGRFSMRAVCADGAFLWFQGDAVFLGSRFSLADAPDLRDLEVRLDARSTFRIVVADATSADAFTLQSVDDRFQPLFMQVEQLTMSVAEMALVDGRSSVGSSREGEVIVVLMRGGEEVRRARVFLPAGGVHEVQL